MTREILPVIWSEPCTDECQLLENIYKVEYQSDYFYEQISIFFHFFLSWCFWVQIWIYIFLFVTFSLYQKISKMTRMFPHPNFYALIHINQVFFLLLLFARKCNYTLCMYFYKPSEIKTIFIYTILLLEKNCNK